MEPRDAASNRSLKFRMHGTHRQVGEIGEVVVDDVRLGRARRGAHPPGLEARVVRPYRVALVVHTTPVGTRKWREIRVVL